MISLLTDVGAVPPGVCALCRRPMDEGGCRQATRWISADLDASRGVEKIVDVFCSAVPVKEPTAQDMGTAIQRLREVRL